jgi:hypothetical protein
MSAWSVQLSTVNATVVNAAKLYRNTILVSYAGQINLYQYQLPTGSLLKTLETGLVQSITVDQNSVYVSCGVDGVSRWNLVDLAPSSSPSAPTTAGYLATYGQNRANISSSFPANGILYVTTPSDILSFSLPDGAYITSWSCSVCSLTARTSLVVGPTFLVVSGNGTQMLSLDDGSDMNANWALTAALNGYRDSWYILGHYGQLFVGSLTSRSLY